MESNKNFNKHIVLLGYTSTCERTIKKLLNDREVGSDAISEIILVDKDKLYDIEGVHCFKGDFNDEELLRKISIKTSKCCVIFSDDSTTNHRNADIKSVSTVFSLEKEDQNIHTITEVQLLDNVDLILSNIKGDEVIVKELIDAKIIYNSLLNYKFSSFIYDILGNNIIHLEETNLKKLGVTEPATFRDLKIKSLKDDFTCIGKLDTSGEATIFFNNDEVIESSDRIFYYKNN